MNEDFGKEYHELVKKTMKEFNALLQEFAQKMMDIIPEEENC